MPRKKACPKSREWKTLPRWACIAIAARSLRRIEPWFRAAWPDAPAEHVQAVAGAIEEVEASAATAKARPFDEAERAALTETSLAAFFATRSEANFAAGIRIPIATWVAQTVALATFYMSRCDAAQSADLICSQVTRGCPPDGAAHGYRFGRAVRHDFELLAEAATREAWTDDTPVPPSIFGPLWPYGIPDGWPAPD